jgi:hypothetical protein
VYKIENGDDQDNLVNKLSIVCLQITSDLNKLGITPSIEIN